MPTRIQASICKHKKQEDAIVFDQMCNDLHENKKANVVV